MAIKPNGKSPVTSDHDDKIMLFRDVTPGPHETQLRFRLIHFWEAWNPLKKTLIGIEMLLIDEQGSVIQGFIPPSRIERHLSKMKPGSLYKLNNFYGSSNKTMYRVSDHAVTVSFSWNSELSVLEDSPTPFDEDRFRFHSFEEFQAGCDRKGDLYGTLALTTMSSSRVFMDCDVQPTVDYFSCTIGQKHNFCVKVTKHNLDGKSRSLTVTKILPLESPPVTEASGGNYNPTTSEDGFETGTKVCEASKISVDSAEGSKSNGDIDEMGKAKRLKRGV
ncbi:hypothetical protein YC2023_072821 [Brassica napus]